MQDGRPVFDKTACIRCAGCEEFCPESSFSVKAVGFKVVAGGSGARFPRIAATVTEFTDLDGVLAILERAADLVSKYRNKPGRVFVLGKLIDEAGIDRLRP